MAPPVFTGNPLILSAVNAVFPDPGVVHGNVSIKGGGRFLQIADIWGPEGGIEILLDAPFDLSASVCFFLLGTNFDIGTPLRFGFSSGSARGVNFRTWQYPTNRRLLSIQAALDPSSSDLAIDGGTFDPSDVQALRVSWSTPVSEGDKGRFEIYRWPFQVNKQLGLIAAGGDEVAPLRNKEFADYLISKFYTAIDSDTSTDVSAISGSRDHYDLPIPITIGDGSTPSELFFRAAMLAVPENQTGLNIAMISVGPLTHRVNVEAPKNITVQLIGSSKGDSFEVLPGVVSNFPGFSAQFLNTIELGDSNAVGEIFDSTGEVSGGGALRLLFSGSTSTICYRWSGADLSGSVFDSPQCGHYISLDGADFADGATIDVSVITFASAPAGNLFVLNAPEKQLNFFVGSSGLDASVVDVIAGTLNVIANQLTLGIAGVPAGSELRIYDLDETLPDFGTEITGTESLVGTSFEWIHSKAGDQIYLQIFSPGFKEFGQVVTLLPVSQVIEPELEVEDAF